MFKKNTLYNVIFPIWFIPYLSFLLPNMWWLAIIILVSNFLIDSIVYIISLKVLKIAEIKDCYKKCILKIWGFGFLADIIGGIFMILPEFMPHNKWFYDNITSKVMYNPYESICGFLWVLIGFSLAVFFIFLFNYKVSFKKLDIEVKKKKQIALTLAIATAPYLFLIPTAWFH